MGLLANHLGVRVVGFPNCYSSPCDTFDGQGGSEQLGTLPIEKSVLCPTDLFGHFADFNIDCMYSQMTLN